MDILYLQAMLTEQLSLQVDIPQLVDDQLHLWLADIHKTRQLEPHLRPFLSQDEMQRAQSFRKPIDQCKFIVQRGILRLLIAHYLEKTPQQLVFHQDALGKPSVAAAGQTLAFNLSHAGDYAMYAICLHRRVGVDIEKMRSLDDILKVAQTVFSSIEISHFEGLNDTEQRQLFFHLWVRKESYLKARGIGFQQPPTHISIHQKSDEPGHELLVHRNEVLDKGWWVRDLVAPLGYAAACCYSS